MISYNISNSKITVIDVILGQMIKSIRINFRTTQVKIAQVTGLTFQQIQKYEHGVNRMPISRLIVICNYYNIPTTDFINAMLDIYKKIKDNIEDGDDFNDIKKNNIEELFQQYIVNSPLLRLRKNKNDYLSDNHEVYSLDNHEENNDNPSEDSIIFYFNKIKNKKIRKQIYDLIYTISINNQENN
ncbi:MAG: helix-turn-helix domain-containing protein [Anaplasmataceae bacterium]|nr:helix-turn-helix domain-containing protein [Anaplasmataceae bacterium]